VERAVVERAVVERAVVERAVVERAVVERAVVVVEEEEEEDKEDIKIIQFNSTKGLGNFLYLLKHLASRSLLLLPYYTIIFSYRG